MLNYNHVKNIVQAKESKYKKESKNRGHRCSWMFMRRSKKDMDVHEDGPPKYLWNSTAPSTEESRMQFVAEGSEQLTEVPQEDLQGNQSILASGQNLRVRYESAANHQEIPPDQ